jgi:hypothetical protein
MLMTTHPHHRSLDVRQMAMGHPFKVRAKMEAVPC